MKAQVEVEFLEPAQLIERWNREAEKLQAQNVDFVAPPVSDVQYVRATCFVAAIEQLRVAFEERFGSVDDEQLRSALTDEYIL